MEWWAKGGLLLSRLNECGESWCSMSVVVWSLSVGCCLVLPGFPGALTREARARARYDDRKGPMRKVLGCAAGVRCVRGADPMVPETRWTASAAPSRGEGVSDNWDFYPVPPVLLRRGLHSCRGPATRSARGCCADVLLARGLLLPITGLQISRRCGCERRSTWNKVCRGALWFVDVGPACVGAREKVGDRCQALERQVSKEEVIR